ncbi:MAG: DUF167 family protein [Rhizomicrobium sp.]
MSDPLRLAIRLTPKGGRDAIEGWARDSAGNVHLKARVRAVPEDGKANAALVGLLAKTLDIPKSHIAIIAGATARLKRIEITGDSAEMSDRLISRLGPAPN